MTLNHASRPRSGCSSECRAVREPDVALLGARRGDRRRARPSGRSMSSRTTPSICLATTCPSRTRDSPSARGPFRFAGVADVLAASTESMRPRGDLVSDYKSTAECREWLGRSNPRLQHLIYAAGSASTAWMAGLRLGLSLPAKKSTVEGVLSKGAPGAGVPTEACARRTSSARLAFSALRQRKRGDAYRGLSRASGRKEYPRSAHAPLCLYCARTTRYVKGAGLVRIRLNRIRQSRRAPRRASSWLPPGPGLARRGC